MSGSWPVNNCDRGYLCSLNGLMRINLGACKFRVAQAVNGSFDLISYGLSISYLRFKRFRPSRSWYGHVSQNCPHLPPWTYHNHLNAWDMYLPVYYLLSLFDWWWLINEFPLCTCYTREILWDNSSYLLMCAFWISIFASCLDQDGQSGRAIKCIFSQAFSLYHTDLCIV